MFSLLKDAEVPDSVYDSLKVPSLTNEELRKVEQFYTYDHDTPVELESLKAKNQEAFDKLKHLQMQVDHLKGTLNIIIMYIIILCYN